MSVFLKMSRNYKFHNPSAIYFVSFATVFWIDVFIRQGYFSILERSLRYCRKYKGMGLYAYCIMPSHVHLVFRSIWEDPSGLLRDFKGYTARKLIIAIHDNPKESRKKWMLDLLRKAGHNKSNVDFYQFWQHHNKPIELWSTKVIKQKIDYIHRNPVVAGFVTNEIEWKYSSARFYAGEDSVLDIDDIGFLED